MSGPRRAVSVGEGFTAACFGVSMAAAVALAVVYWRGGQSQLEGLFLALALGGIGVGIVVWAKHYMPPEEVTEERHSLASTAGSAVRVGPGQMPQFDQHVFDAKQLDSIARYVVYLHKPKDPGGLSLGRIGPIPEGFLIWVFGMGVLLVTVSWIGKRNRPALAGDPSSEVGAP